MAKVKPIPEGYHAITPYIIVEGAARAIDFYKRVFDATELLRIPGPDGRIGHAELRIGDSVIMLADQHADANAHDPRHYKGSPVSFMVYVPDCDATMAKAIEAGAKERRALKDQWYGDRSGMVEDPFGHVWNIATHVEDLSEDEMKRRAAAAQS